MATFEVTLSFQFPAWNETAGITYEVQADSKSEANAEARRLATRDGHMMTGKGRLTFKAVELEATAPAQAEAPQVDVDAILAAHPQIGRLNSGKFYTFPVGGEYREALNPLELI